MWKISFNIPDLNPVEPKYIVDNKFVATFCDHDRYTCNKDGLPVIVKGLGLIQSRHVCQCWHTKGHPRRIVDDGRPVQLCMDCLGVLEVK